MASSWWHLTKIERVAIKISQYITARSFSLQESERYNASFHRTKLYM